MNKNIQLNLSLLLLSQERNTPRFETFNQHVANTSESVLPLANEEIIKKKCNDQGSKEEHLSHKLFKRKKQFRTWKNDEIEGPLYTDPYLIDKTEHEKNFRGECLFVTSKCIFKYLRW